MKRVTVTGIALALMTGSSALAQTAKFDQSVAKAAARKAAEKVGEIRNSINYDQKPEMVKEKDLKEKNVNTSFLPPIPDSNKKTLPPMTSVNPHLDMTFTGSIAQPKKVVKPRIIWEKFDRYGNPIN